MPPFLQPYVDRVGGPRRALIALVGLATAVLILMLSRWAAAPAWVPAFSGLPLEQVGELTDQLQQAGIEYRLEQGGAQVLVPATELARARVLLAQGGALPSAGRPGLELFDQPSWGMTDFTQRVNYRRALEGELERTIGKMRGIDAAQVHLALHETQSFRRAAEKPGQASVVLKLKDGSTPPADVVQGIAHLVASSVDGIESERVTVLDETGRLLSLPHEANTIAGLSNRQLGMQQEIERYVQGKAEGLLAQLVGPGNARVQVSAKVNFDRVERTTQLVDPERQAISTEQKAEITPGAEGGAASSNVATAYETSRSTEVVAAAPGGVSRLTVAVLVNDRLVPPDSAARAAAGDGPPPPPTYVARTPAELQRIETLVRNAVGYDSARGDVVSVVSMAFAPLAELDAEPAPTLMERVQEFQQPAVSVLGLLLAFAVAVMAVRALRPLPMPAATPALAAGAAFDPAAALAAGGAMHAGHAAHAAHAGHASQVTPAMLDRAPSPTMQLREQIMTGVEQNPDAAVRLVRSWMRDG